MTVTSPICLYESRFESYMQMNEDELKDEYRKMSRKLNKKVGFNEMGSFYARQYVYELEQALKAKNIKFNEI